MKGKEKMRHDGKPIIAALACAALAAVPTVAAERILPYTAYSDAAALDTRIAAQDASVAAAFESRVLSSCASAAGSLNTTDVLGLFIMIK